MYERKFQKSVKVFIEDKLGNVLLLTKEFEVASTTVLRWATGVASPHPLIKQQIINWINKNK